MFNIFVSFFVSGSFISGLRFQVFVAAFLFKLLVLVFGFNFLFCFSFFFV
jgi:hypothetical protein